MAKVEGVQQLRNNLGQWLSRVDSAALAAAKDGGKEMESWMKTNARWQDITGQARQGLGVHVQHTAGSGIEITAFNSAPHGVFLELRWGGRYAIIRPAVDYFARRIISQVQKAVDSVS